MNESSSSLLNMLSAHGNDNKPGLIDLSDLANVGVRVRCRLKPVTQEHTLHILPRNKQQSAQTLQVRAFLKRVEIDDVITSKMCNMCEGSIPLGIFLC